MNDASLVLEQVTEVTGDALVRGVDADGTAMVTRQTQSPGVGVVTPGTLGDAAAQGLHQEVFSVARQAVLGDAATLAGTTWCVT